MTALSLCVAQVLYGLYLKQSMVSPKWKDNDLIRRRVQHWRGSEVAMVIICLVAGHLVAAVRTAYISIDLYNDLLEIVSISTTV